MSTGFYDDDDDYLPYEEGPRHLDDYNHDVFDSISQAQGVYDWLQENWNPNEGGYSPDDVFDRITNIGDILYDEDGRIEKVEFDFEGSP